MKKIIIIIFVIKSTLCIAQQTDFNLIKNDAPFLKVDLEYKFNIKDVDYCVGESKGEHVELAGSTNYISLLFRKRLIYYCKDKGGVNWNMTKSELTFRNVEAFSDMTHVYYTTWVECNCDK